MQRVSRRDFLRVSALGADAVAVSTGLAGCGGSSSGNKTTNHFQHGVASGDPLQDRVLLWARTTPIPGRTDDIEVGWEVATDADFRNVIRSGTAQAQAAHDFTLKVDVLDLLTGVTYHYRFRAGGRHSPVGVAKTLPEGAVEQVKFAVVSCSNYPFGFFNVYREVAQEEGLDAILHLGDYLYEYSTVGYGGGQTVLKTVDRMISQGRFIPAEGDVELVQLEDYRRRYALYRTDPDLQRAHAAAPFIAVWDDHEVANDTWKEGAQNHNVKEDQGDFAERKRNALQAYFEWMPVRPATQDNQDIIYRSFHFGDLVSLHMLDTRIIGRDRQVDMNSHIAPGTGLNLAAFQADLNDPNRSLLGDEQQQWLFNQLSQSTAVWQVLG